MVLDFIYSPSKRKELESILRSRHPTHSMRLYFTGFLHHACGLNSKEIKHIIETKSNWGDYKPEKTDKHVSFICKEPCEFSSEDFSSVGDKDDVEYRYCRDYSIFGKLNRAFFKGALKTSYEYSTDHFNVYGKMQWNSTKVPIYRSIENHDGSYLFYIDLDTDTDLELCWSFAKQLIQLDNWEHIKFSGAKGFHLARVVKNTTRKELLERARGLYNTIETNLIYFGYSDDNIRPVLMDVSAYNLHRFIRGYCVHLKSKKYSIPVTTDMKLEEILNIASDINKIKDYIK